MNYFIFNTGGDWDSTTLYLNGNEFPAIKLYIAAETGRDEDGSPHRGGLRNGGNMSAYVIGQDAGSLETAIFPGKIDLEFPMHKVTIENNSPMFAIELTQVTIDGKDVSEEVLDLLVDIDATANQASAYLTLFKPKLFGADEVGTYNLL